MIDLSLSEIAKRIEDAGEIWIVTHRRPDGDAVGSAFGLKFAILAAWPEKQVEVWCADAVPERLLVLSDEEEMYDDVPAYPDPDLTISVDVASRKLLGYLEEDLGNRIHIKIDHHESGDDFAPEGYVDASAAASGEIIFDLIAQMIPDKSAADEEMLVKAYTALYGAIASDTGGFRYANVSPATFHIAAALLEGGVRGEVVSHALFESKTQEEIRATQAAYDNMTYHLDGRIAMTIITVNDMHRYAISDEVLGIVSALPREIAGVHLGITIRQSERNGQYFRISMRSDETVNVSELCAKFNGGGHTRAAGGELKASSPEEACRMVLEEALCCFPD